MKTWIVALLACAALLPAGVHAADAPDAEAKYQTLLAAAKADPDATDWQALRFAYADRSSFSMFAADDGRKAIAAARATHDWNGMLAAADKTLAVDYVDGGAHLARSLAEGELGKADDAAREQKIGVAILKSVMAGHDGSSPDQAFVVISVAEEYELMAARERQVTQQSLSSVGGHAYDVITAKNRDGDSLTFYFLIDRVMAAEMKLYGH